MAEPHAPNPDAPNPDAPNPDAPNPRGPGSSPAAAVARPLVRSHPFMRALEWLLVGLGALVLLGGIMLLWGLRTGRAAELLEDRLVGQLRDACGVELDFISLRIEPTDASMELSGLEVRTPAGEHLLSVGQAVADLRLLPLLRGRVEIPKITLEQPRATLRVEDGRLVDLPACLTSTKSGSAGPPPLGLESLALDDGRFRLTVDDQAALDLRGIGAAIWPAPSGGREITARIGGGTITLDGRETALGGLRLAGHIEGAVISPRSARLDQLQASLGPLELDASGEIDLLGPVYDLAVGLRVDLDALDAMSTGLPRTSGTAEVQLELGGIAIAPRASGVVVVREGRFDKFSFGDLTRVRFRADLGGVDLEEVRVELGPGRAVAEGRIELDDQLSIEVTARPERLSFARFMDAIGEDGVWVDFSASGVSRAKGSLLPLRISGPFDFRVDGVDVWKGPWDGPATRDPEARMLDSAPARVKGRWTFTKDALRVEGARLTTDRSQGAVSALIRHADPKRLEVDVDFERLGLADLGGLGGIDFRGAGALSGRLGGPFGDFSAAATLNLEGIAIADIPLGGALAELRWDGEDKLSVAGIEGTLGATRWHGDVDVDVSPPSPVRVRGEITRGRLGDLLLPLGVDPADAAALAGDVRGRFALDGPVSAWSGPVRLEASDVRAYGEGFGDLSARGRLVRGRVNVDELTLVEGEARTTAAGWLSPSDKLFELEMKTSGLRLAQLELLSGALPGLEGGVSARAELEGPLTAPRGEVRVRLSRLRAGDHDLGDGGVGLDFRGSRVDVSSRLPELGLRLESGVELAPSLPFVARIELERAAAPNLVGTLLDLELEGTTSLVAQLEGQLGALGQTSGDIDVGLLRARLAGTALELQTPARIRVERGDLLLDDVTIVGDLLRVTASGPVGLRRVDLALDGQLDLRTLSAWIPSVERSAGRLAFTGSLERASGALDLVGSGRIEAGALEWRGIPNRFSGIRGELTFSQRSVLVDGLTARWAGGRVRVDGSMLLEDLVPRGLALSVRVNGARPRFPLAWMDLSARIDGGVEVTGDWPKLYANGALEVREGRAVPQTDISEIVGARRLAGAYDPSAEIIELDVGLPLVDPFRVDNDDVDVTLSGELRLTGTNERMGLLGALALERGGRLTVVGREYLTEGGLIEMADRYRVEPRYDLQLSTSACDARIRLNLVGNLDEVKTSYSSNPEMDREDIVSCLVRGIRRRDLDRDLASFAGSALLKLSGVDRQVKRVLPIDQIDVTTEFSSRARAYEPRVLVAKDLSLLDRPMRFEYSTSLYRNDDQRAALRVRLTPRLSLQLGWTSSEDVPMGDWGLDLKRRWEW